MAEIVKIQLRRGTSTDWTTANTVLISGEPGYETDTGRVKYGDGSTAWNSLPYFNDQSEELTMTAGATVNADRVVVNIAGSAYLFDPTNSAHYRRVVGISLTSATVGNTLKILTNEQIATGLTLISGGVYFGGSSGVLTTTPPSTGILQPVGVAITTSKLLIDIQTPILKL